MILRKTPKFRILCSTTLTYPSPVGEDIHQGFTGGQSKNNTYTIKVDNYQTGASFKIKAMIYGDISSDSNGAVTIRKQ